MLALRFTFPAGRYHASPWNRHVNEGEVAWPPDPWRLLRALIATWYHKVAPTGRHAEATLASLIEILAESLPEYTLPPVSHSHTRHQLPQKERGAIIQFDGTGRRIAKVKKSSWVPDTALVFDAFVAVNREKPLFMSWPDLDLAPNQAALLDDLLEAMGYLGRAESWVEASRVEEPPRPDCIPGDKPVDRETGELYGEVIQLYAPLSANEYAHRRARFTGDQKQVKKLAPTLPESLLDALCVDTAALQKQGWNQPPAARRVSYIRPLHALHPQRTSHEVSPPRATTAQFLLVGRPLPRVEDSLRIGELLRSAVMSRAGKLLGQQQIPSIFSGHGLPADNRHQHAFFLPWDADGDGRIDHALIHVPAGLDARQQRVIEGLCKIWQPGGAEWRLVFEGIGYAGMGEPLTVASTVWCSVTPYLHPWYAKRHFTVVDQIRRECRERGLPDPSKLERLDTIRVGGRHRRPIHFRRFRSKRGLIQPDRTGSFWRFVFTTPVTGPLSLGFGCHFGLGLFRPERDI